MDLLGIELVILSGCKIGFGCGYIIREGLIGLIGGFFVVGIDRIVVSFWRVGDWVICEFMICFY